MSDMKQLSSGNGCTDCPMNTVMNVKREMGMEDSNTEKRVRTRQAVYTSLTRHWKAQR